MNFQYKKFLQRLCVASIGVALFADARTNVLPYLQNRASDLPGKVVGMNQHNHLFGLGSNYGTFDIRPKYSQSIYNKDITDMLFGPAAVSNSTDDDSLVVKVSDSFNSRQATDLEADQFLLPNDFASTLNFKPRAQQFRLDLNFYMAFDEWVEGLFMRVRGDFIHSRHDLKFTETDVKGDTATSNQLASFAEYASGKSVAAVNSGNFNGGSFEGLKAAKFDTDSKTCNEFGDLYLELGYNMLLDEDYHFGVSGLFIAPTGKKPNGEWLWEPRGSNGGHFGLGGSVTSHYTLWRSEDEETHLDFAVDAEITHLFNAKQTRTLDLKNKVLSRYLLAKKMKKNEGSGTVTAGQNSGNITPALQFADVYAPVANISTQKVKSSFGVQADVTGMFTVVSRGWSFDLGYNFFALSSEKLEFRSDDDATPFAANTWALAGLTQSYGFNGSTAVALSGTASGSTIFGKNNTLDSVTNAWATNGLTLLTTEANGSSQAATSSAPMTIALADFDLEGAETRAMSHKVFTNVAYTWVDREDWVPFIGAGAEFELGHRRHHDDSDTTSSHDDSTSRNTARTQWGVWLRGGVSFN